MWITKIWLTKLVAKSEQQVGRRIENEGIHELQGRTCAIVLCCAKVNVLRLKSWCRDKYVSSNGNCWSCAGGACSRTALACTLAVNRQSFTFRLSRSHRRLALYRKLAALHVRLPSIFITSTQNFLFFLLHHFVNKTVAQIAIFQTQISSLQNENVIWHFKIYPIWFWRMKCSRMEKK